MRSRVLCVALVLLIVAGCSRSPPSTSQSVEATPLKTIVIEPARVAAETSFDGVIEAVNQATVAAQTSGRVLELPYDVGDYVEKGSVIVRLRNTEQRARADSATAALTEAQARVAEAQLAYDRIKDLFDKNMVAKAAYDKAAADLKSAKARVEAASSSAQETREGLGYTTIRAPYSGIVVSRQIEVGEIAAVGQALMTGLSLEELRAVVDIPQEHIGPLRKHKEARVALADGRWIAATQVRIPPSADPKTQSFRVYVMLPKGDYALFPGTLVKVAFTTGEDERLLAPASAVVHRGEITAVYVVEPNGRISFRYIRVGTVAPDDRVPILAGVIQGEQIALDPVAAGLVYQKQALARSNT